MIDEAAARLGQLCVTLAAIFAPQVIIIGSLARHLGDAWVRRVEESFREGALPVNSKATKICAGKLGESLQDLSAIAPVVVEAGLRG